MPSLILYVDENINENLDLQNIEKNIIEIIVKELEANKETCQVVWIKTKIKKRIV